MKKISLYAIGLFTAFSFASCDDYVEPNPPAQSNMADPILQKEDVDVTPEITAGTEYNLTAYAQEDKPVVIAEIACDQLPAGYNFISQVEISMDNFTTTVEVPSTVKAIEAEARSSESGMYQITVAAVDFQNVYQENFTKDPGTVDLEVRFLLYTQTGNQYAYVGGPDAYYGPWTMTVIPYVPVVPIEEAYYLLTSTDNYAFSGAIAFTHQDTNVYDDPVFTVNFEIPEGATSISWQIIPQSTYEAGSLTGADYSLFGTSETYANETKGELVTITDSITPIPGTVTGEGEFVMTINLDAMTFAILPSIEDTYYFLGNATTWDFSEVISKNAAFFHNPETSGVEDPVFYKNLYMGGTSYWKIAPMSAIEADSWDAVLGTVEDGDTALSGTLVNVNAQAGEVVKAGWYQMVVDMSTKSYQFTQLADSLYLIGAPSGWNINSSSMALVEEQPGTGVFIGTFDIPAGQFQFRFYHKLGDWDMYSIGSQNEDDPVPVVFTDSVYVAPIYAQGTNATSGKGTWQESTWTGGKVTITVDLNKQTIGMKMGEGAITDEDDPNYEPGENLGDTYDSIYLVGGPNGWDIAASDYVLTQAEPGSGIYSGSFDVAAGTDIYFRFYTTLGDWGADGVLPSIGPLPNDNTNVTVDLSDGPFTGTAVPGKGSWNLASWDGGKITMTINASDTKKMTVEFEAE